MRNLYLRLNKINNTKLNEYPLERYWMDFKKWAYPQVTWISESVYLANAKIKLYLNAPLVATFGTLKEESIKFIMSQSHKGMLWLPNPVEITLELISYISSLLAVGDLVPMVLKSSLEEQLVKNPRVS